MQLLAAAAAAGFGGWLFSRAELSGVR